MLYSCVVYPWLLILAISKYTLQWQEVYLHCRTTITTLHLHINLAKLILWTHEKLLIPPSPQVLATSYHFLT